ncbi:16S rRNA (cytidine(1402)-2'-O)-methyltransferase [Citricoccus sp. SGAir0253]|uniref:16S rRNA (cytidine(1402)-2'-O)-methyltransferase n=1 Tax=Citricoccus sp. SGAir0253 TaxID=2567881 RepID=UPI0010CD1B42|nr:16S rRNA (cytidine(1402)-2'-O)-methyltransferase [Citricoccus sp. SGAir0253]QCU78635.1 16S rRNA (cytidine(1402)-2'-O)-methyltransferase [Citricoccus sp. SGAir0253]
MAAPQTPGTPAPSDATVGGRIVLAATPIGNLSDASQHLRDLLATADVVAAEDTRRAHHLAQGLGVRIAGRVVSHHEHNERESTEELLAAARGGAVVAVVTDAGMPLVSDPGYRLVSTAAREDVPVTCAPGPSAVTTALALSGLPTDRFAFEGFLPRKEGERARLLAELSRDGRTLVFFESPHRLAATLSSLREAFGADRPACVARELTKLHEEVVRDSLDGLVEWAGSKEIKGEIVIVTAGATAAPDTDTAGQVADVEVLVASGTRLKEAVAAVAAARGVAKRELYEAVLASRQ